MGMTILKTKSIPTTNLVEVLTIIDMLLLTTRSLVHLMENSRHGVHNQPSVNPCDTNVGHWRSQHANDHNC